VAAVIEVGEVRVLKGPDGSTHDLISGPSLSDPKNIVDYAVSHSVLKTIVMRKLRTPFAHYRRIVSDGLVLSQHCFQGHKRRLYSAGSRTADEEK